MIMGEAAPCRGYFPQTPIFPAEEWWGISRSAERDKGRCPLSPLKGQCPLRIPFAVPLLLSLYA